MATSANTLREKQSQRFLTERLGDVRARGLEIFVDTGEGADGRSGKSWRTALATMNEAFDRLAAQHARIAYSADHSRIHVVGKVTEQITAPQDVCDVFIQGHNFGNQRHSDGDDNLSGAHWTEAATAGDAPLLTLREQGWRLENLLMVPQSGYSAVKLHRTEAAAAQDASHAIFRRIKFISGGTRVGYGIEDYGGTHHIWVDDCDFVGLEFGFNPTNVSIASPLRNRFTRNRFLANKHDIVMNGSQCIIGGLPDEGNIFMTAYNVTTHPNTVNMAYTGDPATGNLVANNLFADAAADVVISKGYKPSTGDIWRNYVTDTAAYIVAVPS